MYSFFVHAAPVVPPSDLHEDDANVAAIYLVEATEDETNPLTITAVLNEFHDHVGIKVLDDFEIGVKNEAGEWMMESDNEDDPDPDDLPDVDFCGDILGEPLRESLGPPPRTPRPSI